VVFEEGLRIPAAVHSLTAFRRWAQSDRFPARGRIDYLEGEVEVDISPEDLYTHGAVKVAVTAALHDIVAEGDLGHVFVDGARVTSPQAELSAEPDVVAILWESLDTGRARHVPGRTEGRVAEIEGAPDLVVEIVSDGSVRKDHERLPVLYARAGIPELWRIDARGSELSFEILSLAGTEYRRVEADHDGWIPSAILGLRFRLTRRMARHSTWRYRLESSKLSS
jgi:Uma2 family endonuclease